MFRSLRLLSINANNAILKGGLAGAATASLYLLVVVITTPNLPATAAIYAAFAVNSIVIGGAAMAVGAQTFFSSYSKRLGCQLGIKELGAGSGGTAIGSFFSFFSLVPLGCCGTWLFILSLLPSVFGGALSVFLIDYSRPLSYLGVAAVLGMAALSGLKLYRRMRGN